MKKVLKIKTGREEPGGLTYVSGGAGVASGGVYNIHFGELQGIEIAFSKLTGTPGYGNIPAGGYTTREIISGNVVAVQVLKAPYHLSGVWVPCLSGEVMALSGEIKVVAVGY